MVAKEPGMSIYSIAEVIRIHGAKRASQPAIIHRGKTITFGEFEERSNRVANGLRAEGIVAQDRVAFLDKNTPEYFDVVFGASKLNAVSVAVNWRLSGGEAAYVVNDSQARVFVVGQDMVPLLEQMESELHQSIKILVVGGHPRHEAFEAWCARHDAIDPEIVSEPGDVAFQFYSSGTTGLPKGVMLTNDNCFSFLETTYEILGFTEHSVSLVCMPIFHVAGGFWALLSLYFGLPAVLQHEVVPAETIELIARHGVTHAVFAPAVMQFMLALPESQTADFSSLECICYGASPISEDVLRNSIRTFGCRFLQAYGLTETAGGIVVLGDEDHDPDGPNSHRLRAAGKPTPGTEMRLVDSETLRDVPVGEVGEVLIRSRQNMKGYWNRPDDTAKTRLPDGWLRTGDAAYVDEDGYLYIHDRVNDMIVSGGENIYPAEVENCLMSHPAVADVAVIGVPDDRWGETPKAMIVRAEGSTEDEAEMLAFAREHLAHYKCPTSVEWVPALPRNPSGKILKSELRAPYWKSKGRMVN
jgi:long-chain acyl-CoA synthetase